MVSQHLKEKVAMGMLLSTASARDVGTVETQNGVSVMMGELSNAVEQICRPNYPAWSKFRYDLIVGFAADGSLHLYPLGSQRAKTGCLLSEVAEKLDKKYFWLLSAPMRKTSENTVRAVYTLSADETELVVFTGQTRWGAMTNAYLGTVMMNGQPMTEPDTWDGYVHLVLTGGDIDETGEYASAKEGDVLKVKDNSYTVDRSPVFDSPNAYDGNPTEKQSGGSNLLEIASRI